MKQLIVSLVGLGLWVGAGAVETQAGYDFSPYCPFATNGFNKFGRSILTDEVTGSVAKHRELKADPRRYDVIFFGDSMVNLWNEQVWREYWEPLRAGRFGVVGDRVEQAIWRLNQGELKGQDPKVIVVWLGINNAGINTDREIADGLAEISRILHSQFPKANIKQMMLFPAGELPDTGYRRQIRCVNAKLKADFPESALIDLGGLILDDKGHLSKKFSSDALHLTEPAYRAISGPLRDWLITAVPQLGAKQGSTSGSLGTFKKQ